MNLPLDRTTPYSKVTLPRVAVSSFIYTLIQMRRNFHPPQRGDQGETKRLLVGPSQTQPPFQWRTIPAAGYMGRIDLSFVITPSSRLSTWKKWSGDPPIYTIQRRREKSQLGGTPSNRAYARYRHFGEAERNYQIFEKRWEPTEGGQWVVYQLHTLRENNWTKSSKKNQWKLPNPIFHTASEVMQTKLLLRAQESSDSPI